MEVVAASGDLASRIEGRLGTVGDKYIQLVDVETLLLRRWLQFLGDYEKTGTADVLLEGVASSIIEVASCLTVGFGRVALGSIRAQIDLVLSWLYFKDHPVEWARLESHGEGYMQKSELLRYLSEKYSKSFASKFAVLKQGKTRLIEDPFSLLSAHLHKQAAATVVTLGGCADVVCSEVVCNDVVTLQSSTTEYLNDVLLSCYSEQWAAIPAEVIDAARARLTPGQEKQLFA